MALVKKKPGQTTVYIDKEIRASLERLIAMRRLEKLDDEDFDLPVSVNGIVNEALQDYLGKYLKGKVKKKK